MLRFFYDPFCQEIISKKYHEEYMLWGDFSRMNGMMFNRSILPMTSITYVGTTQKRRLSAITSRKDMGTTLQYTLFKI